MLQLKSPAFGHKETIPKKYTGEGKNVSPPLSWSGAPDNTKEFALICDDPDAPRPEPWVHWVLYCIPPDTTALDEGDSGKAAEGVTSFGSTGYGGPMPPPGHGKHRYQFTLYALDSPVKLDSGATKQEVLDRIKNHILEQTTLIGLYER